MIKPRELSQCAQCHKRKAKRFCPGLGADLCALCCGLLREKKIRCPSACPFLARHKPYQEDKLIRKRRTFSEEVVHDDRLHWLLLHLEAPLKEIGEKRPDFTDREAILALEYVKGRLEKGRPRLIVSRGLQEVQNAVGEAVWESLEKCRYQTTLILPQDIGAYTEEEKLKCLEHVISTAKQRARGRLDGRAYLDELARRFAKIEESSRRQKITRA
jgi:hypothetical protein